MQSCLLAHFAGSVAVRTCHTRRFSAFQPVLWCTPCSAGSEFLRSLVFGAMDGILTSFGIVASIYGSSLSAKVVILLGFSNVIADGVAMGVGDALSAKAENDHTLAERKREEWEYDHYKEGEVKEMVQLYMQKGFNEEDATRIIQIMSKDKYKDFFIDHMMIQELGQEVPDPDDSPAKAGALVVYYPCG